MVPNEELFRYCSGYLMHMHSTWMYMCEKFEVLTQIIQELFT